MYVFHFTACFVKRSTFSYDTIEEVTPGKKRKKKNKKSNKKENKKKT